MATGMVIYVQERKPDNPELPWFVWDDYVNNDKPAPTSQNWSYATRAEALVKGHDIQADRPAEYGVVERPSLSSAQTDAKWLRKFADDFMTGRTTSEDIKPDSERLRTIAHRLSPREVG